ncbi:hypothetical protein AAJCM20276_16070 [Acetobacter aceti]|uniref:Uncharacterized protein n=1 Tax=Acetobacter aceti TaxID=435 RepID=A0A6S6PI31_ACEAC|nr:hypothetical protein AAJCM20276_16070 [Acetobacter aceti]
MGDIRNGDEHPKILALTLCPDGVIEVTGIQTIDCHEWNRAEILTTGWKRPRFRRGQSQRLGQHVRWKRLQKAVFSAPHIRDSQGVIQLAETLLDTTIIIRLNEIAPFQTGKVLGRNRAATGALRVTRPNLVPAENTDETDRFLPLQYPGFVAAHTDRSQTRQHARSSHQGRFIY